MKTLGEEEKGRRKEMQNGYSSRGGGKILYFFMLSFEFVYEVVDKAVVEVLTAQVCVTGSRLDLEDTFFDSEERHIESSTTEIEDQYIALTLGFLVETVCDSCGGGFVDNTKDVQTCNKTGIFGGLTLRVVEVGWDRNHSVVDSATEI